MSLKMPISIDYLYDQKRKNKARCHKKKDMRRHARRNSYRIKR